MLRLQGKNVIIIRAGRDIGKAITHKFLMVIANVFAFLVSDEVSFITGEAIVINGGQLSEEPMNY